MSESSTKKVYVWKDIDNVNYVSIIDNNKNEIICPVTAKTENIALNLSYTYNESKNKDFTDVINKEYYYKNRNGKKHM